MTNPRSVEFFFDVGSPTTYLAYTQLPALAAACGASVVWRPMLLGGVFKATGNQSPAVIPAKSKWMGRDMQAFARRYGVPFKYNPNFPINTMMLMRGAVAMEKEGAKFEDIRELVAGARGKMVYATGDADEGIWSAGQVQGLIHDIPSCAELVSRIMREAEAIVRGRLEGMLSGAQRQAAE